jgi:cytochrome P450
MPAQARAADRPAPGGPVGRPASEVPGPRIPGPLQSWLGIAFPVAARREMRKRYGPVFRSKDSIAGELFHVADRELIEQMFKWKPAEYTVSGPRRMMEPVVGPASLLLLDGARHLRMRKLMLPSFHGRAIAGYGELIAQIADRAIDGWSAGETVRTRGAAQTITLEVMIRAVFGVTDPDRVDELMRRLPRLSSINPVLLVMQKDLGPLSPWGRFVRNRDRVDELLYDEIDRRREAPDRDERNDVLTLLLSARDEDGEPLTDRELRDELITILLAGHETTATSIGWAFERLLRTPAALDRLTAEVKAGESEDYLEAVVKEALRVRPVVTEVFRSPSRPTELGGYLFEPGSQIAASISLVQVDPDLYAPDPLAFRPERFLEGAPESYTWIPFGGGVRRCIGAQFALLEMKIVIARILARARLRAPRARGEKARFRGVTLLPGRGGEAVVESVSPAVDGDRASALQVALG